MAIRERQSISFTSTTATIPSWVQIGDMLVMECKTTASIATPTGWNLIGTISNSGTSYRITQFWRKAISGDAGSTFTVTGASFWGSFIVPLFDDGGGTVSFDTYATATTTGSTTDKALPTLTPTNSNADNFGYCIGTYFRLSNHNGPATSVANTGKVIEINGYSYTIGFPAKKGRTSPAPSAHDPSGFDGVVMVSSFYNSGSATSNPIGLKSLVAFNGIGGIYATNPVPVPVDMQIAAGDIFVAVISETLGSAVTPPSGWTQASGSPWTDDGSNSVSAWYRQATGSESGSYSWSGLGGDGSPGVTVAVFYHDLGYTLNWDTANKLFNNPADVGTGRYSDTGATLTTSFANELVTTVNWSATAVLLNCASGTAGYPADTTACQPTGAADSNGACFGYGNASASQEGQGTPEWGFTSKPIASAGAVTGESYSWIVNTAHGTGVIDYVRFGVYGVAPSPTPYRAHRAEWFDTDPLEPAEYVHEGRMDNQRLWTPTMVVPGYLVRPRRAPWFDLDDPPEPAEYIHTSPNARPFVVAAAPFALAWRRRQLIEDDPLPIPDDDTIIKPHWIPFKGPLIINLSVTFITTAVHEIADETLVPPGPVTLSATFSTFARLFADITVLPIFPIGGGGTSGGSDPSDPSGGGGGGVFHYTGAGGFGSKTYTFGGQIIGQGWPVVKTAEWKTVAYRTAGHSPTVYRAQWGWTYPVWHFEITYNFLRAFQAANPEYETVLATFAKQLGPAGVFLYEDPLDNLISSGAPATIGIGVFSPGAGSPPQPDNLHFQLVRPFYDGSGNQIGSEPVFAPKIDGNLVIYKNGTPLTLGADYVIGSTGLVTFASAIAYGDVVAWSGGFRFMCRFEEDDLPFDQIFRRTWKNVLKFRSFKP